eukprot:sb/3477556/
MRRNRFSFDDSTVFRDTRFHSFSEMSGYWPDDPFLKQYVQSNPLIMNRCAGKFIFRIFILVENTRIVSIPNFRIEMFPFYEFFEKHLRVFPEKTQICLKNLTFFNQK